MAATVQGGRWSHFARVIVLSAALAGAGCAPFQTVQDPREPKEVPGLGVLDSAYDRTSWRAFSNPDGRTLLEHTALQKCFVNPQPDPDFETQGFTVKRDEKTIGPTRYQVYSLFEKLDLWEVIYVRAGSKVPLLGVFAAGPCQIEAERILQAYEKALQKQ